MTENPIKSYQGSCLCQQVCFSIEGFRGTVGNCHCTMCRKFHGAAFATLVNVEGLTWLSGLEQLKDFVAPNGTIRTFCSHCGSSLGFRSKDAPLDEIEIAIATFDEDLPISVEVQIYCAYKANWSELSPTIKTFLEEEA